MDGYEGKLVGRRGDGSEAVWVVEFPDSRGTVEFKDVRETGIEYVCLEPFYINPSLERDAGAELARFRAWLERVEKGVFITLYPGDDDSDPVRVRVEDGSVCYYEEAWLTFENADLYRENDVCNAGEFIAALEEEIAREDEEDE